MTAPKERVRAERRFEEMKARFEAAASPEGRLSVAYDWFRAAQPPAETVDALARQIVGLAAELDMQTSGH